MICDSFVYTFMLYVILYCMHDFYFFPLRIFFFFILFCMFLLKQKREQSRTRRCLQRSLLLLTHLNLSSYLTSTIYTNQLQSGQITTWLTGHLPLPYGSTLSQQEVTSCLGNVVAYRRPNSQGSQVLPQSNPMEVLLVCWARSKCLIVDLSPKIFFWIDVCFFFGLTSSSWLAPHTLYIFCIRVLALKGFIQQYTYIFGVLLG